MYVRHSPTSLRATNFFSPKCKILRRIIRDTYAYIDFYYNRLPSPGTPPRHSYNHSEGRPLYTDLKGNTPECNDGPVVAKSRGFLVFQPEIGAPETTITVARTVTDIKHTRNGIDVKHARADFRSKKHYDTLRFRGIIHVPTFRNHYLRSSLKYCSV